jgi:hypothetical protein
MKPHTIQVHGLALALLAIVPQAMAQNPADDDHGYHHQLDAVDADGSSFQLSVRHCRALANAVGMMSGKHGWRISLETTEIVHAADVLEHFAVDGSSEGWCPRPTTIDATYDAADPLAAVQAVAAAYNANNPPYTASVGLCGEAICMTPADKLDAGGLTISSVAVLDTVVTLPAETRTAREALTQLHAQMASTTTPALALVQPPVKQAVWDEVEVSDAFVSVPAREVLTAIATAVSLGTATEHAVVPHEMEQQAALRDAASAASEACVDQGMADGLDAAGIDAACGQLEADAVAAFTPDALTTPTLEVGLGPGWSWSLQFNYDGPTASRVTLSMEAILAPTSRDPSRPLAHTTPVPGLDTDGDGVDNSLDLCDGTRQNVLVLADGCSVAQSCPCAGTGGDPNIFDPLGEIGAPTPWANNRAYTGCIGDAVDGLVDLGLLSKPERASYKKAVTEDGCGD